MPVRLGGAMWRRSLSIYTLVIIIQSLYDAHTYKSYVNYTVKLLRLSSKFVGHIKKHVKLILRYYLSETSNDT